MVVELPSPETYVRFVSKRVSQRDVHCFTISLSESTDIISIQQTGKVLADDDGICNMDKDPAKAEHWWRVIPTNGQSNRYIIKNVTTGRAIWCRYKNRRAGCIGDDGKWPDNWFVFEETKLPGCSGTFRIRCPATNCTLASRTDKKPEIDGILLKEDGSDDSEDQHFTMNFEDMDVENIEYDIKAGKKSTEKPAAIASQDLENLTDTEQIQTFTYNEDKAEEHSFEHSHGFEVSISSKFKFGAWPIWTGELELKLSQKNEWKWGEKNTITTKWGVSQALKVPKNSTYVATLTATRMEISVPFKMTWVAKDSGAKNITYGVYKGVSYYNASTSVKPKSGASGTTYKEEGRSFEDNAEGEEHIYPVEDKQEDSSEPYEEETNYNVEQSYDGQETYTDDQDYDNGAEQNNENSVEPETRESRSYEEGYEGGESRKFNEESYDEQGSYSQRNEDGHSYNTGYEQNKPEETDNQEQASYEPNADSEEPSLQSSNGESFLEDQTSYEEHQYDEPQVDNLSLDDSLPSYQGDLNPGNYGQQTFGTHEYESNQFSNLSTEENFYNSTYQDAKPLLEDDRSNEQRYGEGESKENMYGQTNEYDQSSKSTYEENSYDQADAYGQSSNTRYEDNNYEQPSEDNYNNYRNGGYDQSLEFTYEENNDSSYRRYQQY